MKKMILSVSAIFILFACSSDDDNNTLSQCEIAVEATLTAKQNYDSATEENYVQACNAYKAALENQQQTCGDADGSLQAMINNLGDCSGSTGNTVEGQISVRASGMDIMFDVVNIQQGGGVLKVTGETSSASNYSVYFEVEEDKVGDDSMQNFEIHVISTFYPVDADFNNSITANTNGTLTGTFSGIVKNNDNAHVELTNGNFNLSY